VTGLALHDPIGFSEYLALSTIPFVFGDGFVTMVDSLSPGAVPAWNFSTSGNALSRTIGFGILPPGIVALSLASKAFWALVLVSAIAGFVVLLMRERAYSLSAIAILFVVAYFMFAGGPVQSARYRQPVEPLIFVLSGIGIASIMQLAQMRRTRFLSKAN
jgi:lysylphosphatidylglycerol synthetase-like protein (DUF2156 family)